MQPLRMTLSLPKNHRTSDLLRLAQHAAGRHLDELGFHNTAAEQGLAWVIIRTRMEILCPPDETLTVETWPGTTRLGMMPRYCLMYNADGQVAVRMVVVWALADILTRQMRLDASIPIPDMSRGDEPPMPRGLPKKDLPRLGVFTPQSHQIDKNGHMNNAAYPDAAEDAAADLLAGKTVTAVSIDYRAEILPETEVAVHGAEADGKILLCGKKDEKEFFRMMLTCAQE